MSTLTAFEFNESGNVGDKGWSKELEREAEMDDPEDDSSIISRLFLERLLNEKTIWKCDYGGKKETEKQRNEFKAFIIFFIPPTCHLTRKKNVNLCTLISPLNQGGQKKGS